jgi:hypothetical protein
MDFGRRSISSIKQILKSKILDIGKEDLCIKIVGEIIVGSLSNSTKRSYYFR